MASIVPDARSNTILLPPTTPFKARHFSKVNDLVLYLNSKYPQLQLRPRSLNTSPASRAGDRHELCYDRLNEYFYINKDKLDEAIDKFRREILRTPGLNQVETLINYLPKLSSTQRPKMTPVSSFPDRLETSTRPRATTPELELDEDDRFVTPPGSPSPSVAKHVQISSTRSRKRHSTEDFEEKSPPKFSRGSTVSTGLRYSNPTTFYTPAPSPTQLNTSFNSTVLRTSFASTIPIFDGAADNPNVSFNTDITVPDAPFYVPAQNERDSYPSSGQDSTSLATQDRNLIDGRAVLTNSRASGSRLSDVSKESRVVNWIKDVTPDALGPMRVSDVTSLSSDTQAQMIEVADKISHAPSIVSPPLNVATSNISPNKMTPTRAMQSLRIEEPTSGASRSRDATSVAEKYQIRTLPKQGLFAQNYIGPPVEFRMLWESTRLSLATKIPVGQFLQQSQDYDQFKASLPSIIQTRPLPKLSAKFVWDETTGNCSNIQFKARLTFSSKGDNLFDISLDHLEYSQQSCRFQRKFGNHRILYVQLPDLDSLSQVNLNDQKAFIKKRVLEWLDPACPKFFLGRDWRAIHLEAIRAKNKPNSKFVQQSGYRVILFATTGGSLEPISVQQFLNWFIDLKAESNLDQSYRKLFSRLDLGFSKTVATVVFKPTQVFRVADKLADGTPESSEFDDLSLRWPLPTSVEAEVMDDGCSRISVQACRLIWEMMGNSGPIPAVFQGRIGGAKGVWIRSGPVNSMEEEDQDIWIEVSESQEKFRPHQDEVDGKVKPDRNRWTFEVLNYSKNPPISSLHMDMINLLHDRGVPIRKIQDVITKALVDESNEILEAMKDPVETRYWLTTHYSTAEEQRRALTGTEDDNGRLPLSTTEKAIQLLEHGFTPSTNTYLAEQMLSIAEYYFSGAIQSLSVRLDRSALAIGIADPYGLLQPGEIHLAFSKPREDDETGECFYYLDGKDVLVTRHPMLLPSDIQRVRTIYHPGLSHLLDVVIFPSIGITPLASKLQGGDYDGDKFFVSWETAIVDGFKNAPSVPANQYDHNTFNIEKDTRHLREVLAESSSAPEEHFLKQGFKARLQRDPLGMATNFLKKLIYAERSFASSGVQKLAHLYGILIDADKNGYNCDDVKFNAFIQGDDDIFPKNLPEPAYKTAMKAGVSVATSEQQTLEMIHPNDIVFFKHIRPPIIAILKQLDACIQDSRSSTDSVLMEMYNEKLYGEDEVIRTTMKTLKREIFELHKEWVDAWKQLMDDTQKGAVIEKFQYKYKHILPDNAAHAPIAEWTKPRLPSEPTTWDLIKASILYTLFHQKKKTSIIFQLAGTELCYIKAFSSKNTRFLVQPLWAIMKPRKRKNKLLIPLDRISTNRDNTGQGHIEDDFLDPLIDEDDFYSTVEVLLDED